jgi:hypothetical protein
MQSATTRIQGGHLSVAPPAEHEPPLLGDESVRNRNDFTRFSEMCSRQKKRIKMSVKPQSVWPVSQGQQALQESVEDFDDHFGSNMPPPVIDLTKLVNEKWMHHKVINGKLSEQISVMKSSRCLTEMSSCAIHTTSVGMPLAGRTVTYLADDCIHSLRCVDLRTLHGPTRGLLLHGREEAHRALLAAGVPDGGVALPATLAACTATSLQSGKG